ncbi:hypothetical protein [Sodalis sp. RH19]|uniref:hypothetical protein n=1 Tax=Sodalis sp. RH19 TaxID=3394334 RepID=UPI0039B55650
MTTFHKEIETAVENSGCLFTTLKIEHILTGLLFDVVSYLADELKAPCWICIAEVIKFIIEVEMAG